MKEKNMADSKLKKEIERYKRLAIKMNPHARAFQPKYLNIKLF